MRNISNKADNVGDSLPALDFNDFKNENQNIVTDTYQTLDAEGGPTTDTDQLGKAIALMVGAADFYADSGAVNAYVLGRSTTLQPVPSYRDGLKIAFIPGNTNSGASTVNVSSLGVKNITLQDGSALAGGELIAGRYYELRYNLSNDRFQFNAGITILPRGYIDGLVLSNEAGDTDHDIEVAAGICRSTGNDLDMQLSGTFIKRIDAAWAEGTNQGGFPSGLVLSADTWYNFFIIGKADGSQFDFGWDTSSTAANLLSDASAYSSYRRLGSILTDGSDNIIAFYQVGDWFWWAEPIGDFSAAATGTKTNITVSVPPGIRCLYHFMIQDPILMIIYITSPDLGDPVVGSTTTGIQYSSTAITVMTHEVITDDQSRISQKASGTQVIYITTYGYKENRGKDS